MFKKNAEYIRNEDLKQRLEKITLEESKVDMSYCMTTSNDYLLMKNEIPLDDINNPRAAVQEMLKENIKQEMNPNDIIITFGIGLCYQLDEVYNTYPSRIFVYEPDTKLLHFVLNNVDISDHLKSGRVFLYDRLDDLIKKLSEAYITKDKVEIIYLKNYAVVRSQELLELTQKVYETCKSKSVDINTITRYSKTWLENTLNNIAVVNNSNVYQLSDLEDKFAGQTAVILGAGPSLIENINKIKENREKYVIFAANKVLHTLISNNLIPDFVVCLDAKFIDKTLTGLDDYLPKINCITSLNSDSTILTKNFKKIFVSFPENDLVTKKLKDYNQFIKTYENGGTATTLAFVAAVKAGFSPIVLCGVDLSFKGNVAYSSGETFEELSDKQIKINNITKNLTTVKSVTGEQVLTSEDYRAFVQHFGTLIKEFDRNDVYNTSSFGAAIPGTKNTNFDSIPLLSISNTTSIILGELSPVKIDTKKWAEDELFLINNVISLLSSNTFSPALVSSVVKSSLMYQYMQTEILTALQSRLSPDLAEDFINKTKESIKIVVELLQKNRLI